MGRCPLKSASSDPPSAPVPPDPPPPDDDTGPAFWDDLPPVSINSIGDSTTKWIPTSDTKDWCPPLHDPDVVRAQLDTGASASCTNLLHMLHDYRAFSPKYPCPVRLLPATEGSDAVPLGLGFLHVPCDNGVGFLPIPTYYHPSLRATVIDERDIIRGAGFNPKGHEFTTHSIIKHLDTETLSVVCTHHLRSTQDIIVHGVLLDGKCYTHPLIPPLLPVSHPHASPLNS